jgi:hypothetical protein
MGVHSKAWPPDNRAFLGSSLDSTVGGARLLTNPLAGRSPRRQIEIAQCSMPNENWEQEHLALGIENFSFFIE